MKVYLTNCLAYHSIFCYKNVLSIDPSYNRTKEFDTIKRFRQVPRRLVKNHLADRHLVEKLTHPK
jgi:hypothetical protein